MPELKRKRQTSVALLKKTRTKHYSQHANLCILNPAFAIDSEVKNNMVEKDVKGNNRTACFPKLSRKMWNDDSPSNDKASDLNEEISGDAKQTGQTRQVEAPLAEIRSEVLSDVSSGEHKSRSIPEETGTSHQGTYSDSDLEIRAEPDLTEGDATYDIPELKQHEVTEHGEVRG